MMRKEKIQASLNLSTPSEVLAELSRDEDKDVRWRVARNTSTPLELLLILMVDDEKDVRERAERALNKRAMSVERHAHSQE